MKRYTINNRRSDCLIKEKLIAEATEEAAAAEEEATPQKQHKMFNINQYFKQIAEVATLHQSLIPQIRETLIAVGSIRRAQEEYRAQQEAIRRAQEEYRAQQEVIQRAQEEYRAQQDVIQRAQEEYRAQQEVIQRAEKFLAERDRFRSIRRDLRL